MHLPGQHKQKPRRPFPGHTAPSGQPGLGHLLSGHLSIAQGHRADGAWAGTGNFTLRTKAPFSLSAWAVSALCSLSETLTDTAPSQHTPRTSCPSAQTLGSSRRAFLYALPLTVTRSGPALGRLPQASHADGVGTQPWVSSRHCGTSATRHLHSPWLWVSRVGVSQPSVPRQPSCGAPADRTTLGRQPLGLSAPLPRGAMKIIIISKAFRLSLPKYFSRDTR